MARGFAGRHEVQAHHASAAKVPNSASGTSLSKLIRPGETFLAKITSRLYTLMLTILRMTKAPRICMTTATASIFVPIGSVNSTMT